ncbi:MAG: sensor domain-containing diguanylate cyclase [Shewanella sp.]
MLKKIFTFALIVMLLMLATENLVCDFDEELDKQHLPLVIAELNEAAKVVFNDALVSTEVIDQMVNLSDNHDLPLKKFNRLAAELKESYRDIDTIVLLPNGIVSYIYPLAGNTKGLGINILEDNSRSLGSKETKLNNDAVIIGPVKLNQNGTIAFIVRRSVYTADGFWGFVSITVNVNSIINAVDKVLIKNGIENYQLLGHDPDSKNKYSKMISSKGIIHNRQLTDDNSTKLTIFNHRWELSIVKYHSSLLIKFLVFLSLLVLVIFIMVLFSYFRKYQSVQKDKNQLVNDAHTDFLTGLLNRRGFEHQISHINNAMSYGTVAIFDIDFFKKINDTYGHDVGDIILVGFANCCKRYINSNYVLSRSGGEEFILLMPNTQLAQAALVCDKLRTLISKENFAIDDISLNITMSAGIAEFQQVSDIKQALTLADKALYRAKHAGRDQVCVSQ